MSKARAFLLVQVNGDPTIPYGTEAEIISSRVSDKRRHYRVKVGSHEFDTGVGDLLVVEPDNHSVFRLTSELKPDAVELRYQLIATGQERVVPREEITGKGVPLTFRHRFVKLAGSRWEPLG